MFTLIVAYLAIGIPFASSQNRPQYGPINGPQYRFPYLPQYGLRNGTHYGPQLDPQYGSQIAPGYGPRSGGFYGIPGNYCNAPHGKICCADRIDRCSIPVLGTMCYCDSFCDKIEVPDCCPDYWSTCLGLGEGPLPLIRPPVQVVKGKCTHEKRSIANKESLMDNCNKCTCTNGIVTCETDSCLVDSTLFHHVSSRVPWRVSNYSRFWGQKLEEGINRFTGTFLPDNQTLRMHPIKLIYEEELLPKSFDARNKWDNVGSIKDQGWCAASWAFSTLSVAEDRFRIASHGKEGVTLSPQHLLSCITNQQNICTGGHVERAWHYLRRRGLVTEDCYPFSSGSKEGAEAPSGCQLSRDSTLRDCGGVAFPMGRTELYTTEPAYRIASREGDIMWELLTNGPVQALMRVYRDFFLYRDGIYSRENLNADHVFSHHSVKILGWGVQRSHLGYLKYWLVANSWGPYWGMSGTFKIKRGTNECGIEQFILAVRPRLAEDVFRPRTY